MKHTLRNYMIGWRNLIISILTMVAFEIVISLPLFPFALLFPDQLEGKAEGTKFILPTAIILLLLWAPFAAYMLGPVKFASTRGVDTIE